jgi:hypothetical protein
LLSGSGDVGVVDVGDGVDVYAVDDRDQFRVFDD